MHLHEANFRLKGNQLTKDWPIRWAFFDKKKLFWGEGAYVLYAKYPPVARWLGLIEPFSKLSVLSVLEANLQILERI